MGKRKLSTALAWIIKEAKKLKREYPRRFAAWKDYVKQASAIYASKHKGKSPVGHKHKKISGMRRKKRTTAKRKAVIKRVKAYHRKEGHALRSLGAVRSHVTKAKHALEKVIGDLEVRRFKAKRKAHKRKIGKQITAKKGLYRRLYVA
jgi:hypothetical protein